MHVISLANQKGGVGKSSCTFHLGGTLAAMGARVLLVDADPQSSLTQGIMGPAAFEGLAPAATLASVYAGEAMAGNVVHATPFDRVWLLPGHGSAASYNSPVPEDWRGDVRALAELVGELDGRFDHVLIDCPPNLHFCTYSAMLASTHVLVPLQPEDYGAQGMASVTRAIRSVQEARGGAPEVLGYVLTMVQKLSLHAAYEAALRGMYGALVLDTRIPASKDYKEAVAERKPIVAYRPRSASAKVFAAMAAEVESRLGGAREVAA